MALNLICAALDRGPCDARAKLVLIALADSADRDSGECFPALRTIAARAGITPRGLRDVLKRLRADGWLDWSAQYRANGSRRSNLYVLNLAKLGEAPRASSGGNTPPAVASPLYPSHHNDPCARPSGAARSARSASPRKAALRACSEGVGAVAQVSRPVAPAVPGDASACAESRQAPASDAARQFWADRARALSPFERSSVRKGASVLLAELGMIAGNSPQGQALRAALAQVERAQ